MLSEIGCSLYRKLPYLGFYSISGFILSISFTFVAFATEKSATSSWLLQKQLEVYKTLKIEGLFKSNCELHKSLRDARARKWGFSEEMIDKVHRGCLENETLDLPTSFQHPGPYKILSDLAAVIEQELAFRSIDLSQKPLLGTIPSGQMNAKMIRVPIDGGIIILFSDQIFTFSYLLSKVVAQTWPLTKITKDGTARFTQEEDEVIKHINTHPEIVDRFRQLLIAQIVYGWIGKATPYELKKPYDRPAITLTKSIEHFIVGHEYGHIVQGDLTGGYLKTPVNDKSAELIILSQKKELLADNNGLRYSAWALARQQISYVDVVAGPTLFFVSDDLIHRALGILRTGRVQPYPPESTHPSPQIRLRNIRLQIEQEGGEFASNYVDFSRRIEWIVEVLWGAVRQDFVLMHKNGVKPSPIWDIPF